MSCHIRNCTPPVNLYSAFRTAAHQLGFQGRRHDGGDVLAATAVSQNAADPLSGLVLSELAQPRPKPGWAVVKVVSSSLNMAPLAPAPGRYVLDR